ncbi:MAG: zinc-ribbon domain-containing protein [Lachnospiraceae bacterium]|nr:zinc-ribbon domain-containing protein [Lachnospiraceae bacterium]
MSFCGKCGREVPEGALFCMKCGRPIPEKQSIQTVTPVYSADETTVSAPEVRATAPSEDRKRTVGVIPIILTAIICLALIGGIYIYQSNAGNNELTGSGDALTRMIDRANDNLEYIDR